MLPGLRFHRSSTCTRTPAARSSLTASSTKTISSACPSGSLTGPLGEMGTTTACVGATAGGSTRPESSECDMMSAPTSRVLTPHEVAHTRSCELVSVWKVTSKALAKFWPRKCEVPLCSAQPFCMRASIVYVSSAPAKRSVADLTPLTTGIASTSRQTCNHRYPACSPV